MNLNLIIIIALILLAAVGMITISIVVYNFMLLLSELNKRLIYIISDILGDIDLSTPHLDTLNPQPPTQSIENIIEEASEESNNYFNPHEYDVENYEGENE